MWGLRRFSSCALSIECEGIGLLSMISSVKAICLVRKVSAWCCNAGRVFLQGSTKELSAHRREFSTLVFKEGSRCLGDKNDALFCRAVGDVRG